MFAKFHYGGNDSYLDKLFMPFLFSVKQQNIESLWKHALFENVFEKTKY